MAEPRRGRAGRALAALGALVAAGFLGWGLYRLGRDRVAIGVLYGAGAAPWAAALGFGAVGVLLTLARAVRGARGWSVAVVLRRAVVAFVLTVLGFAAFVRPFEKIHFDLATALAAGGFGWLLFFSSRFEGRLARGLDLATFSLCAAALLAEGALRAWGSAHPSPLLERRDAGPLGLIQSYRLPPGQMRLGFPINSRGWYDEEFGPREPGVARVVVIGDSFSVGVVPHEYHYTTVAERELGGAEVLNVGTAALGIPEYATLLETEVPYLEPDLVVIAVFVGNDLETKSLRAGRRWRTLRQVFDRDNLLLWMVPQRLAKMRAERAERGDGRGAGEVGGGYDRRLEGEALLRAVPWIEDPSLEIPTFSLEAFREIERNRAREIGLPRPSIEAGLDALFDRLVRAAKGTPLAVMIIPDELQVEEDVWALATDGVDAELDRERPQRLVRGWCEARGLPVLDLLPLLRAVEPTPEGRRHVYLLRDTHFNVRGNRVAGEALAELVRSVLGE